MAKYNILDEDDIFSESGSEEESQESSKQKKQDEEPEINIDGEELFDDSLLVDEEQQKDEDSVEDMFKSDTQPDIELDVSEDSDADEHDEKLKDFFKDEEQEKNHDVPESPAASIDRDQEEASEVHQIIEEYEDEKLEGLNYKPFVIGGVIIILLVAVYFVLDLFVLGGDDIADQPVEQTVPAEPQLTPEQIRKNQQLAQIAGRTNNELSFISDIINVTANESGNLSSLMLYDKSFMLEIFGSDRAELAKVQRALNNSMPGQRFDIVSASTRPGENGGIFGIYALAVNGSASPKQVAATFSSVQEMKSWLSGTSERQGLTFKTLNELQPRTESGFRVFEVETLLTGSMEECKDFLTEVAGAAKNLKIHKLNLATIDQRSFNAGNMRLKIILQLYI